MDSQELTNLSDQELIQAIVEAREDSSSGFFSNPDPEFLENLQRLEDLAKERGLIIPTQP